MQIRDDLLRFPEFVLRFGDRVQQHLQNGGALTPESVQERWDTRVNELQNAIVAESARWGDYRRDVHRRGNDIELYERDVHWLPEHERLRTEYFPRRSEFVYQQFVASGWVPSLAVPDFLVNDQPQHGGRIDPGDLVGFTVPNGQQTVVDSIQLVGPDAVVQAWVPADDSLESGGGPRWYDREFEATGWTSGTNGVGYENSANGAYRDLLGTDVATQWNANRSSVYTRFEFDVDEDWADYDRLLLDMTYDDGFVAYLNGTRMDVDPGGNSNLAPDPARWNSLTTGDDRPDSVVLSGPVSFDLSQYMHLLQPGTNLLAVHGLSHSTTSSDMLILPELLLQKTDQTLPDIYFTTDGRDPRDEAGAVVGELFAAPISITASTSVRARVLAGTQWSALLEADFLVETLQADINHDGEVDFADFLILSGNFGLEAGDDPLPGDIDEDGQVGFGDFLILAAQFGATKNLG